MRGRDLLRGLTAGLAGTAVLKTTTRLEAVLRGEPGQPVDYDDTRIPARVLESVTGHEFASDETERFANQVLNFGYGSAAGVLRTVLDGRVPAPAVALFALTWGGEVAALPLLGLAPPIWRWRRDVLASSIGQHLVYALVTDAVYRGLGDASAPAAEDAAAREEPGR